MNGNGKERWGMILNGSEREVFDLFESLVGARVPTSPPTSPPPARPTPPLHSHSHMHAHMRLLPRGNLGEAAAAAAAAALPRKGQDACPLSLGHVCRLAHAPTSPGKPGGSSRHRHRRRRRRRRRRLSPPPPPLSPAAAAAAAALPRVEPGWRMARASPHAAKGIAACCRRAPQSPSFPPVDLDWGRAGARGGRAQQS